MFCIRRIVLIILCTSQLRLNQAAFKGGGRCFWNGRKAHAANTIRLLSGRSNVNWGRSSQKRWIRFTAAFIGVESEKPAECPRYLRITF
jgi:hypothetical protein